MNRPTGNLSLLLPTQPARARVQVFPDFSPLGVVIMGDGGLLFAMACGVWLSGWIILALSANEVRGYVEYLVKGVVRRDLQGARM